jgi:nucleotide-binding universal stress UspA family protein
VLVPHDFSPAADRALRTAAALTAAAHGRLTVLHVIAPFYPLGDLLYDGATVLDPRQLEARVLAKLERHVAALLGPSAARCAVTTGNPGQRIVAAGAKGSCIVMPTSGRTGTAHALIGSVAERVVRFSTVPVLVLPDPRKRRRGT